MSVLDDFSPELRALVDDESKLPQWVPEFRATRMEFGASAEEAEKETLMVYAATEGDAALAERLLKAGVDPDAVISLDDTALGIAAENGHLGVARALIAAGADVNRQCRVGTPLKYAARFQRTEMVKLLLEAGAVSSGAAAAAAAAAREAAAAAAAALSLEPGADFGQAVAALERALGVPRTAVGNSDRAVGLRVSEFHAKQVVTAQQDALLRAGCFAFHYADMIGGGCLALLPATGPLDAVKEIGTEGTNWKVTNDAVVAWLEATMRRYPMRVVTIGEDRLEARLLGPVGDSKRLAKSIIKICPTWQDSGVERVVEMIEEERRVWLWWD